MEILKNSKASKRIFEIIKILCVSLLKMSIAFSAENAISSAYYSIIINMHE
jgi:hypothetical protein